MNIATEMEQNHENDTSHEGTDTNSESSEYRLLHEINDTM